MAECQTTPLTQIMQGLFFRFVGYKSFFSSGQTMPKSGKGCPAVPQLNVVIAADVLVQMMVNRLRCFGKDGPERGEREVTSLSRLVELPCSLWSCDSDFELSF